MHLNRVFNFAVVSKSSLLIVASLFLTMSLSLCGCSSEPAKKASKEDKPVVTDMDIKKPAGGVAAVEEAARKKPVMKKKDEVESLPLETLSIEAEPEAKEEELPVLGGG